MYVTFDIIFPPSFWIDPGKISELSGILPPAKPLSTSSMEYEDVSLVNVDPSQQSRQYSDDMDEDEHHHGPGVQCAQQ